MRRESRRKERFSIRTAAGLKIQENILNRNPSLHCEDGGPVMLENCTDIEEYTGHKLRMKFGKSEIVIEGDDLEIDFYRKSMIMLHGRIFNIRFGEGEQP